MTKKIKVRTKEDFFNMTERELFYEIISLAQGDGEDGWSSKENDKELENAHDAFGEKMKSLGVNWE